MNTDPKKHGTIHFLFIIFVCFLCSHADLLGKEQHLVWKTSPIRLHLENRIPVIYEQDVSSKITVLQFFFVGGKQAEPENKQGLSYITTRLALEIPDRQTAQEFLLQATQFLMHSENDYSAITVSCLSENLKDSLGIISRIMLKPLFSGIRINRIKENMLNRKKIELDDSRNMAYQNIMNLLFEGTGYDHSVYGNEASLKQISKKDISHFYKISFTSQNTIIVVSSNLDKETISEHLNQHFARMKNGPALPFKEITHHPLKEKYLHLSKETQQTYFCIGYRLPPITRKNYVCALMLENLLGRGIESQLWPLRKEKKLAYNVSAQVSYFKNAGMLEVLLETENSKIDSAQESLNTILDNLYSNGIHSEELMMTKTFTKSSFLRLNETKRSRTNTLGFFCIMGLELEAFQNIFADIQSIGLEDMNSYIHEILNPENRVTVIIGSE
ncbi:MAG: peptidase M16 [Candidatus Aminicenantes bacterium]|nr:peptidase M16 [Candidatus Aminicenantes bacterium]